MTDRPIIFSGPMIRALLDGRKTQTRRVLKPQPDDADAVLYDPFTSAEMGYEGFCFSRRNAPAQTVRFPYATGDRLWVREAWRVGAWHYHNAEVAIDYCDGPRKEWRGVDDPDMLHRLIDQSRADAKKAGSPLRDSYYEYPWSPGDSPCRWRPSIHMPRWASRLTLTVTDVRVQRLQDISEADAIAEGVNPFDHPLGFRGLWDSLNAARAPWADNPWVAAYTFTVQHGNIDEVTA